MEVRTRSGEVVAKARTKDALAGKVQHVFAYLSQVESDGSPEFECFDGSGERFSLKDLEDILTSRDSRPSFAGPTLQGCSTPHRVRKPWMRW